MEGEEATLDGGDGMKEVILTVEGMMCQKSCGSTVEAALRGVPGVVSAKASFENSNAIIVGTASAEELIDAIECVGFEACLQSNAAVSEGESKVKEIVLTVEGKCAKSPVVLLLRQHFEVSLVSCQQKHLLKTRMLLL